MKQCYVCDRRFDGDIVLDHDEHVIQNAIGGGLIATGILCQACGTKLGNSVDKRFNVALRALCAVFDIRRHRGGQIAVPAQVTIKSGFSVDPPGPRFSVEHGADPTPLAPMMVKDDIDKVAHLFGATGRQATDYKASPAVRRLVEDGYTISTNSSIGEFVERIALKICPESLDVARGIIKIAISFALQAGVKSALIRHFVFENRDITSDEPKIRRAVQPYFPTGWCEALYEADRNATDDFPPNHQLALFSLGHRLFCHVDLFGVIQRYVLLSEGWSGPPILKRYLQKCPRWIFDPNDWKACRHKDLDLLARQFGVPTTGKSWEDIQAGVMHKAYSRPYELPAADQLEKPRAMLVMLATLPMGMHLSYPSVAVVRHRADVAEKEFGSDFLITLAADHLRTLMFIRDLDVDQFRIKNEKGICPDLSHSTPACMLWNYQKFRLSEFVRAFAGSWSIEIEANPASP